MKCIFCEILSGNRPASVVAEDQNCLVIADLFPLTPGHLLVISKSHQPKLEQLTEQQSQALFAMARKVAPALEQVTGVDACHWLVNDGKAAWQHVPHVHLHLIPRYRARPLQPVLGWLARPFMWLGIASRRRRLDDLTRELAQAMDEKNA